MVNIRNRNCNVGNNNAETNNAANPPPPPTLLVMQAQMLQTMQQTMVNMEKNPQAP
jgi:hypothetical protein